MRECDVELAYDFRTADNADVPHVAVYSTVSDETVCIVPIKASVTLAEYLAERICEMLNEDE
jgi:dihydroneopterin aldolase